MAQDFLAVAFKTALLMCAAGILSLALVRSSAAVRHLVWVSALALALLLPLASAAMPSYAVMDDPWAAQVVPAAQSSAAAASGWPAGLLWPGLIVVWGAGALVFLLRDTLGHAGLMRFGRRARPLASPHWTRALAALDGPAAMRVLESDCVAGPCTWGVFKPVLVLPQAAEGWSEAERRYALTHELAHIGRRDCVSAQIARLAVAVHWYNPLVWYAARQAHRLQEQACDDAVLRAGAVASDYAKLLVGVAQAQSCSLRTAMGMAERSPLYHRVAAILDPEKARAAQSRAGAFATVVPLVSVMALIAGAGLAEPEIARAAAPVAAQAAAPAEPPAAAAAAMDPAPAKIVHIGHHRALAALPPPDAPPVADAAPAPDAAPQAASAAVPPVSPVPSAPAVPALPAAPAPPPPVPPLPPLPSD